MLSQEEPYHDADTKLSKKVLTKIEGTALSVEVLPSARDSQSSGETWASKAAALERLTWEETYAG
jgi:hypothetical protein